MSKTNGDKTYWLYAIPPIIAFSIISGLRFGRDIDYNNYFFIFSNPHLAEQQEILFQYLVYVFKTFGLPYYLFVQFCSTFLIFSFILLLKNYKKCIPYALPLFLLTEGIENLIRWYLAVSFLLIALHYYINNRKYQAIIFSSLACLCHIGVILLTIIIPIIYLTGNSKSFNPFAILLLFIFTSFFSNNKILINLASQLQYLNFIEGRASVYMSSIASEENVIFYKQSITTSLRLFIGYSFFIFIGGKYVFTNKDKWLYNLSCITIVLSPILNLIELFNRYSSSLFIISTIAISSTWIHFIPKSPLPINNKIILWGIASMVCLLYPYFTDALLKENINDILYIWDAQGRNFLKY